MPETNPTIKIYANYSPNTNGEHIIYSNFADYESILTSYLLDTVSVDNYRINQGRIEVNLSQSITLANYKNATYIVHSLDNMCYTVLSATYQSGYVIYEVEVDYWGTYIGAADIKDIRLLKASSDMTIPATYGAGIFPDCELTSTESIHRFYAPTEYRVTNFYPSFTKLEHVFIVFSLQYVVENVNFGNGAITANGLYALSLNRLMEKFLGANPSDTQKAQNAIDVASGIVGGIYGIETSGTWGTARNCDACVTAMYIVTRDLLGGRVVSGSAMPRIKTKSQYGDFTDIVCAKIISGIYTTNYELVQYMSGGWGENTNVYFGTINEGIKIRKTKTNTWPVYIKTNVGATKIQIVCGQGDNQKDITNSFTLPYSTNNGDVTELGAIKSVLSTAVSGAGFVGSLMSGNVIGAIGSGLGLAGNVTDLMTKTVGPGQTVNIGDAYSCFHGEKPGDITDDPYKYSVLYPIGYRQYQSVRNEENEGKFFGIDYNCYIPKASLLSSLSYATPYYVLATVNVDNIPKNAADLIQAKFASGIYLKKAPVYTPSE